MKIENLIGLIGGIVGIISVPTMIFITWRQAQYQYGQHFVLVMKEVNDRYDKLHPILNHLPELYDKCTEAQKDAISRYFNLCSEELLWWRLGFVPKLVWPIWKSGIKEKLLVPPIKTAWEGRHSHEYDLAFQAFCTGLYENTNNVS